MLVLMEFRRNRLRFSRSGEMGDRFEDDEGAYAEEVAETYMRLLEPVKFDDAKCKYPDCSICLKEFEKNESLQMIPNCQHIFHETCLRKWFLQAQICPMCRGNIIRIPNNGVNSGDQNQSARYRQNYYESFSSRDGN